MLRHIDVNLRLNFTYRLLVRLGSMGVENEGRSAVEDVNGKTVSHPPDSKLLTKLDNKTIFVHNPCCENHNVSGHIERPQRTSSIVSSIFDSFPAVRKLMAPAATEDQIKLFHTKQLISKVFDTCSKSESSGCNTPVDMDTIATPKSKDPILHAAGSVCFAVDKIMAEEATNGFCCVRPPGHHATPSQSMGFCFLNNVGIGALWSKHKYDLQRVAVVDFDVHHGNGTQDKFSELPYAFFASTHIGGGFYPGTGHTWEKGINDNIVNVPLKSNDGSEEFRKAYRDVILPKLENFNPDIIFISAGFDAHKDDPLGELKLEVDDFKWVTEEICKVAATVCSGRVISVLEGGYNLEAIVDCATVHMQALSDAAHQLQKGKEKEHDSIDQLVEKIGDLGI